MGWQDHMPGKNAFRADNNGKKMGVRMLDTGSENKRVLFVDDEENILDSFRRTLRKRFEVTTACGPLAGLDTVRDHPPFAVIVSDLKMPKMDGIEFLGKVRALSPDTSRILLTGHADVEVSIAAVNEDAIFRFLTKPCQLETIIRALDAGVQQYNLIVSERELLRGTLRGSITVLTEVLALTNPEAFGRSERIKGHMLALATHFKRQDIWKLELAAMLSQIGCVTLTSEVLRKKLQGRELTGEEKQLYDMHPHVGFDLLNHIPRMREVATIIQQQDVPISHGTPLPFGARALKILLDYDALVQGGKVPGEALLAMRTLEGLYDQLILTVFEDVVLTSEVRATGELFVEDLRPGMITGQDIETRDGTLLATRGQELTEALLARIRNFAKAYGIDEPVVMQLPDTEAANTTTPEATPA